LEAINQFAFDNVRSGTPYKPITASDYPPAQMLTGSWSQSQIGISNQHWLFQIWNYE